MLGTEWQENQIGICDVKSVTLVAWQIEIKACFFIYLLTISLVSLVSLVSVVSFPSFRSFRWFRFGRFVSLFRVLVHVISEGAKAQKWTIFAVTTDAV